MQYMGVEANKGIVTEYNLQVFEFWNMMDCKLIVLISFGVSLEKDYWAISVYLHMLGKNKL